MGSSSEEKMESNDVRDGRAISDQDYVDFINRLREVGEVYENFMDKVREVGKADFPEPNLARSQQPEVSASLLDERAVASKEKRKPNDVCDVDANHIISDSDYTQFCNHLRENVNSNILDLGSNTHNRASAAATMEGIMTDGEIIDRVNEKDSTNMCTDQSIPDPGYMLFLDHLREDGNSYFLELVDDQNGSSTIYRYEEEEEEEQEEEEEEEEEQEEEEEDEGMLSKLKKQKTSQDVATKKMSGHQEKTNEGTNPNVTALEPFPDPFPVLDSHASPRCLDVDLSYQTYLDHLKLVEGDLAFDMKSAAPKSASEPPPISRKHRNTECLDMDVAYQEFLNRSRLEDGVMFLDLKSGGSIRYEGPSGAICGFTGLQKMRDNSSGDQLDSFHYKEKLMDFISRPYDQNEYEALFKKATVRKPLCRQKHLRSMSKTYETKLDGKSYLDYHPRLAKLLKDADLEKGLTLLRGFFFWLQNLSHDGAFQPWMPLQARTSRADNNEDALSSDDVFLIE